MRSDFYTAFAAGVFFVQAAGPARAGEPCPPSPGVDNSGYLAQVRLCAAASTRCKPSGSSTYLAKPAGQRQTATLSIPDIPDGYVISGGELSTSAYDLTNRGFNHVTIASHGDPADYCGRHFLYDFSADWIGDDPDDHMTIEICVRYEKWQGAAPAKACPAPP